MNIGVGDYVVVPRIKFFRIDDFKIFLREGTFQNTE